MTRTVASSVRRALAGLVILILSVGVASCTLIPARVRPPVGISSPRRQPSMLTIILASSSARTLTMLRSVLTQSARPGEQVLVLPFADDVNPVACAAPRPLTRLVTGAPVLPHDATSFQKASYHSAMVTYKARLRSDQAALDARYQRRLDGRAMRCLADIASALRRPVKSGATSGGLVGAISSAVSAAATLEQTGVHTASRRVIVVLGLTGTTDLLGHLYADLAGTSVVVAGLPVSADGAALQAQLVQAGANQATVLTEATQGRLGAVIGQGLDGTIAVTLAHLDYGAAQYQLPANARPMLLAVLRLLTFTYPGATATINGYTDDTPVPGGNRRLSWRRALGVMTWLTKHGVKASRLQAVGHGDADPIAPNRPGGQPLNRRVVIVIAPAP